jgi:hypothetical protein
MSNEIPTSSGEVDPAWQLPDVAMGRAVSLRLADLGQRLMQRISATDALVGTDDDWTKVGYYQFSLSVGLLGYNYLDDPDISEDERTFHRKNDHAGAILSAREYLDAHPDHPVALQILENGINASYDAHRQFLVCSLPTIVKFIINKTS